MLYTDFIISFVFAVQKEGSKIINHQRRQIQGHHHFIHIISTSINIFFIEKFVSCLHHLLSSSLVLTCRVVLELWILFVSTILCVITYEFGKKKKKLTKYDVSVTRYHLSCIASKVTWMRALCYVDRL